MSEHIIAEMVRRVDALAVSAVRDAFEAAGVVTDDRNIRIGTLTFERVPRWDDPMAIVRLERG